jgi:hypothetical protein
MQLTEEESLKRCELLQDLFQHDGWKLFIDEFQDFKKPLVDNAYVECDTNEQWQQRRGALVMLDQVLNYEAVVETVHDQLLNQEVE